MKHIAIIFVLALATITAAAQSTNPLNYSGRMYVEAIEICETPRYVSFEDHAIVTQKMRIPSTQISKCEMDFENGTVTVDGNKMRVKVSDTQVYDTDYGWIVVIFMDLVDEGDKAELVWPETGKPYFQQITPTANGVKIARMILSMKPYVANENDALNSLLWGLGSLW